MKQKILRADMSAMWLIRTIIILICALASTAALLYLSFIPILMWCCVSLFSALAIFLGIIYTPLYFKSITTKISENSICTTSGVIIRNSDIMKISSIQYATLISTPFSKKSGMNFIVLNALGGKLIIPFLKHSEAEELYSDLNAVLGIISEEAI